MKIIVDDKIPYLKGTLEKFARAEYLPFSEITPESVADADALMIRTRTRCDENLLANSRIRFIATATSGNDHIDIEYCRSAGIEVYTARGCNAMAVAQYVITAIIQYAAAGKMNPEGKTIGIIGAGHVGNKVAVLAESLGMKTILNDPPREENEPGNRIFSSLDYLLERSDIVTLHVPLTVEGPFKTYHLASESFFGKVRKNALFINSSRGEVVDEEALSDALKQNLISDYILDVWNNEPRIDPGLPGPAFLCSPHIAGYSEEGKRNASEMILEAFLDFFNFRNDPGSNAINDPLIPYFFKCEGTGIYSNLGRLTAHATGIPDISEQLKRSPGSFETIRANYPFRHEFRCWSIETQDCSAEINHFIKKTGFTLNSNTHTL